MKYIDNFLNKITMYRLVLWHLTALFVIALILSVFGLLSFHPIPFFLGTIFIFFISMGSNILFAKFFKAPTNLESVYITGYILALLIPPAASLTDMHFLAFAFFASLLATASKYILAIGKKHIFNPAAIALVITGIFLGFPPSWWIGTEIMLPFVLIGGFLIVRKIQRADLAWSFIIVAVVCIIVGRLTTAGIGDYLQRIAFDTPLFFFATVMLTEPLTTPPTRLGRVAYGALTGFLFAPFVHVGMLYTSPELALVCGNVFSYMVSPKKKLMLKLKEKIQETPTVYNFVFEMDQKFSFKSGQYLEWTLPYTKPDDRGNRRYFTIASSPTESEIHLGVKFAEKSSTFKQTLLALKEGDMIAAGGLSGEFTLPRDAKEKLVFIAGGIGITPFRSMIKFLTDTNEKRDIVLLYSNSTANEIAYKDIFEVARAKINLKTFYMVTKESAAVEHIYSERVTAEFIQKNISDFRDRYFYISGSRAMTLAFQSELSALGIPHTHIKTDFFPGFV